MKRTVGEGVITAICPICPWHERYHTRDSAVRGLAMHLRIAHDIVYKKAVEKAEERLR